MRQEYEFADLNKKEHLIDEIQNLEEKLKKETGHQVNLIAYYKPNSNDKK